MKRILIIAIAILSVASAGAANKLSVFAKAHLNRIQSSSVEQRKTMFSNHEISLSENTNEEMIDMVISATDGVEAAMELKNIGAEAVTLLGDGSAMIARVPVSRAWEIEDMNAVKNADLSRKMKLYNYNTREKAHVNEVHAGNIPNAPTPDGFTGKDVVVGIIDCGIDINHLAFRDSEGNSRVKALLLGVNTQQKNNYPNKSTHMDPSQAMYVYLDPAEIASIKTDDTSESHGTHTSSTAVGSHYNDGTHDLCGMAPEADIILGCSALYTNEIYAMIDYIFKYAEKQGKAAVVSMSFGSNGERLDYCGAQHDTMKAFTNNGDAPGRIAVIAAGNEADLGISIMRTFPESGEVKTFVKSSGYSSSIYFNYPIQAFYSPNDTPLKVQYFLYRRSNGVEYPISPLLTLSAEDKNLSASQLKTKIDNQWTSEINDNCNNYKVKAKFEVSWCEGGADILVSLASVGSSSYSFSIPTGYYLGVRIVGEEGERFHAMCQSSYYVETMFTNQNVAGFQDATSLGTLNDMAANRGLICVGASTESGSYKALNGSTYTYGDTNVGAVTYFSSYGEDVHGYYSYPDIVTPGNAVVSGYNAYDTNEVYSSTSCSNYITHRINDPFGTSRKHYYGVMCGTSMATPGAAGMLALWLQANPELSINDMREIFAATSDVDNKLLESEPQAYGNGKLNAFEGIKKILAEIPTSVQDINATASKGEVVEMYNLNGARVNAATATPGIYVVRTADGTTAKRVIR